MAEVNVERERSAALLVRVWLEEGTEGFRARVTAVGDATGATEGELTVAVAATPSDLLGALRDWLDRFVTGGEGPD